MNKIKDLLKEHDHLCRELMEDESFVESAKAIFEENGVEFSKEMLTNILEDMESDLNRVQNLPDEKLADVVGGVDVNSGDNPTVTPKKRTKGQIAGSIAIKTTATILGTVLGAGFGLVIGADLPRKKGGKWYERELGDTTVLAGVVGASTGNVIGYRLGKLISAKLGLEEE